MLRKAFSPPHNLYWLTGIGGKFYLRWVGNMDPQQKTSSLDWWSMLGAGGPFFARRILVPFWGVPLVADRSRWPSKRGGQQVFLKYWSAEEAPLLPQLLPNSSLDSVWRISRCLLGGYALFLSFAPRCCQLIVPSPTRVSCPRWAKKHKWSLYSCSFLHSRLTPVNLWTCMHMATSTFHVIEVVKAIFYS